MWIVLWRGDCFIEYVCLEDIHFLEKILKVNYESAVVAVTMLVAKPYLYSA